MAQVLNVGTLLDHGKYRIEKILGQGGFGITYLVTDLGLDKLRALKEFFPKDLCERGETTSQVMCSNSNTAELVERLKAKFLKEARNIANLDRHNGIVRIHTVFEENDTAYYVMDYIEGESLLSLVKREGPLPVKRAVKYIREVGEALEYVHSHHINHLDVKPANIMVRREDDKAILIDFGLSKQYDSEGHQTSTTPTGISHGFAPMEQYLEGGVREFSTQTDLYSLAATLYYLISGETPPQAPYIAENGLDFPANFPTELSETLSKAMSTQRKNRHESVRQFLDSLRKIKNPIPKEIKVEVVDTPAQPQSQKPEESEQSKDKSQDKNIDLERTQINTLQAKSTKRTKNSTKLIALILTLGIIIVMVLVAVSPLRDYLRNRNRANTEKLSAVDENASEEQGNNDNNASLLEYHILSKEDHTAEVYKAPENIEGTVEIPSKVEIDGETYDVTEIGKAAFNECKNLKSITIPNSVTKIKEATFHGCKSLTSITIPNSVTSIGLCAFFGCSSLTTITIPNTVIYIESSAFFSCSNLTSIIIPKSVTSIGNMAFSNCISLTSITIPNSVTEIGGYAFSGCSSLEEVTIPTRFKDEVNNIFRNCPNLKPINYTE